MTMTTELRPLDPNVTMGDPNGRAITYLRVSSKRQMDTAIDIDPDGNSIATQREYARSKAGSAARSVDGGCD